MNIVVCIKQVPNAKTVRYDTEKGTLVREGVEAIINPFDFHALEAGLQLKDAYGGGAWLSVLRACRRLFCRRLPLFCLHLC
ncbi:MAG: hypothetical protein R6T90_03450 [Dissulfuribacterales bacterium]